MGLVPNKNYTKDQYIHGFDEFQKELHSYGVTNIVSISDGNASAFMQLDWYKEIIKENKLKLRIGFVEYLDPINFRTQIEYVINEREKLIYNNEYFKIIGTKIFVDGVVEGRTAYLTSPYEKHNSNEDDYYGELVWNKNDLKEAIKLSNKNNLQVHLHSIGDGATKLFLEKIEELKNNYEELPYCRNVLIHLQVVRKQDIKRMYELDILVDVQPYWQVVDYYYLG